MNVTPATQKLLISLIVLAFVGYVSYMTFFGEVEIPQYVDVEAESMGRTEVLGQDILILSDQLQQINIDKSVFSSPLFSSLIDISQPLLPEAQGRENPFAPIGTSGVQTSPVKPR